MNQHAARRGLFFACALFGLAAAIHGGENPSNRVFENFLKPIIDPKPLLADYPQFVEPVREVARFEASALIDDDHADLDVRAWRFSYNARGIIEVPNRLRADSTAVIVVHPWGIDDGRAGALPSPRAWHFSVPPPRTRSFSTTQQRSSIHS